MLKAIILKKRNEFQTKCFKSGKKLSEIKPMFEKEQNENNKKIHILSKSNNCLLLLINGPAWIAPTSTIHGEDSEVHTEGNTF